jgi:hypothetical protein
MIESEGAYRPKYAVEIIVAFVRNSHMKRALHKVDAAPHLNFWRLTYGNCLDMAVIEWCKLFGSDHEAHQAAHWKNVIPANGHDEFRRELYAAVGMSADEWQGYWDQMKGYRDNHAAHFSEEYLRPENDPRYPKLGPGLEAAYFYYDRLLAIMDDRGIPHRYPADIRAYANGSLR